MAQRSNRRFLNLISVEAFEAATLMRKRAGGIHHGQESCTPPKAEYIGADQTVISIFRLQFCGGPYIPIMLHIGHMSGFSVSRHSDMYSWGSGRLSPGLNAFLASFSAVNEAGSQPFAAPNRRAENLARTDIQHDHVGDSIDQPRKESPLLCESQ